jgi:hypothetical protein
MATKQKTRTATTGKAPLERAVLIGAQGYGLYIGRISATDAEILRDKAVRVAECRHVRYWYGGTGGITSLAAWGPCGPKATQSRIGAPTLSSLITDVRTVHDLTAEAVAAFAAIVPSR